MQIYMCIYWYKVLWRSIRTFLVHLPFWQVAPKGEVAGNVQEEQIPEETQEQIAEETQDGSGQPKEILVEETLQELLPPQHNLTPEVQPQQPETAEKKEDLPVAALPQEAEEQVEKVQQEEAPSRKPEDEEEQSGTATEEPATAQLEPTNDQLEHSAEQVEKSQEEPVPTQSQAEKQAETAQEETTSDQLQEAVEVKQEEPAPQCLAEEEEEKLPEAKKEAHGEQLFRGYFPQVVYFIVLREMPSIEAPLTYIAILSCMKIEDMPIHMISNCSRTLCIACSFHDHLTVLANAPDDLAWARRGTGDFGGQAAREVGAVSTCARSRERHRPFDIKTRQKICFTCICPFTAK